MALKLLIFLCFQSRATLGSILGDVNKMRNVWKACALISLMGCWSGFATAGVIQCEPSNQRVATLGDAIECKTANSININSSDRLNSVMGTSYNWLKEGELTAAGTNDLFKVTADSWGTDVKGTWYIDASFWTMYSTAVITMHVGEGGGNPDAFAWLITPGQISGDFTYKRTSGGGGGLSNLFLFGTGTPTNVPEANPLMLLLIGLASLLLARRRAK